MGVYLSDNNGELIRVAGKGKDAVSSGLPLGAIIPVSVITNDSCLHLLDGSSLLQTGIYEQFCTWLKSRVLENSSNVPTCTIEEYANDMATYGQCGKFVINDTSSTQSSGSYSVYANSIKLPTVTKFIEGLSLSNMKNIGASIGAGLPNITGRLDIESDANNAGVDANHAGSGAISTFSETGSGSSVGGASWQVWGGFEFDASKSNSIYGNSDTVQPNSIQYPYYIVVATSTKTDVQVDIDNIVNDINNVSNALENKANADATNIVVDSFKQKLGIDTITEISLYNCSTVKQVLDAMYANPSPNIYGRADVGNQESCNFKTLVGNPSGFANYTRVFVERIGHNNPNNAYKLVRLNAFQLYGNNHAIGYMSSDNTNGAYWSGWTLI